MRWTIQAARGNISQSDNYSNLPINNQINLLNVRNNNEDKNEAVLRFLLLALDIFHTFF